MCKSENAISLSLEDSKYKEVMHARFRKLGPNALPPSGLNVKILNQLKGSGGKVLFKKDPRTKKYFVVVSQFLTGITYGFDLN